MRETFRQIIFHNICKANKIQGGTYQIQDSELKQAFEKIKLFEILKIQNFNSEDFHRGFIWVLNTCVFFVAEYNFKLFREEKMTPPKTPYSADRGYRAMVEIGEASEKMLDIIEEGG